MQLQADNEQDRIMDPESMTQSPAKGTACGYLLQGEGTREKGKGWKGSTEDQDIYPEQIYIDVT